MKELLKLTSMEPLLKQSRKEYQVMIGESLCAWSFGTFEAAVRCVQDNNFLQDSRVRIIEKSTKQEERFVYDSQGT